MGRISRLGGRMFKPVTSLPDFSQYLKLGRTEFEQALPESEFKITENVTSNERKKGVDVRGRKILEWAVYDESAKIQTPNKQGTNVDKIA